MTNDARPTGIEIEELGTPGGEPYAYFARGNFPARQFLAALIKHARENWATHADELGFRAHINEVRRGWFRWVPCRTGDLEMRWTQAAGPGRGAFPATWIRSDI